MKTDDEIRGYLKVHGPKTTQEVSNWANKGDRRYTGGYMEETRGRAAMYQRLQKMKKKGIVKQKMIGKHEYVWVVA